MSQPSMSQPAKREPLLRVGNLTKHFPVKGGLFSREVGRVHAWDPLESTCRHASLSIL